MKLNIRDIIENESSAEGLFARPLAEIDRKLKNEECVDRDSLCNLRDTLLREKSYIRKRVEENNQMHCSHDLWMMTGEPYLDDDMVVYAHCTCVSCLMERPFDEESYLNLYRNKRLLAKENMFASGDSDLEPLDEAVSDVRDFYFDSFNEQAMVGDEFYLNHGVKSIEEEVVRHYSQRRVLTKEI